MHTIYIYILICICVYIHIYIYIYIYIYVVDTHFDACIILVVGTGVCEKNAPPEKSAHWTCGFQSTKSGAGEQFLDLWFGAYGLAECPWTYGFQSSFWTYGLAEMPLDLWFSEHQIGGWRAVSAAGLKSKGLLRRSFGVLSARDYKPWNYTQN